MKLFSEREVLEFVAELFGVSMSGMRLEEAQDKGVDLVVRVGHQVFAFEAKQSTASPALDKGIARLRQVAEQFPEVHPVLVVPYMGEAGEQRCKEAGINWIDMSGNARIVAPGTNISWQGRPNRFKQPAKLDGIFAPKIARLARWFLVHPNQPIGQRELARETQLDEGYVSHAIARMREAGYVLRDERKLLSVRNPEGLLDDWREAYDFSKHRVLKGHVVARSGESLTHHLAKALDKHHAATGLSAAWLIDGFAGFRLATFYLEAAPEQPVLEGLGFREEARGANTWLIVPKDAGVFLGSQPYDGVRCVHPVQTYLDLKALPERSEEAAANLRRRILESFTGA